MIPPLRDIKEEGLLTLTPMRFKTFVWPHNPKIYEIKFRRSVCAHKVPFGRHILQNLGMERRVLRGEGEFVGKGAYEKFKELANVFYDETPGTLVHPVWQISNAYLVALTLRQEPREDYVSYTFEFWECYDYYKSGATLVMPAADEAESKVSSEEWYTVVYGDCLWNIAIKNGLTLAGLLEINPQIKNPNILYPGDRVRIA